MAEGQTGVRAAGQLGGRLEADGQEGGRAHVQADGQKGRKGRRAEEGSLARSFWRERERGGG